MFFGYWRRPWQPRILNRFSSSAGAETTATTLLWWVLAMIAYPEIQKRAQDQLDLVVGRARPPTFADFPSLPYVQALVKETLRWRAALPLGIPHSTIEDDWYEGMFIPKGTLCLANLWQCNRDTAAYGDDAASFKPERFLDESGRLIPGPAETRDEGHSAYGFGRRACVGKHAANDSLFISMATVLWALRLEGPRDESGERVPLDMETPVDTGMVLYATILHLGRALNIKTDASLQSACPIQIRCFPSVP
jgi:cytochrome P450